MCEWWAMGDERQNKEQQNRKEKRVLTVCYHPAWCSLLYVCMVLTSYVEKFHQVWSGLTFSLSRHVYSSPIPIKISTLPLPVSLLIVYTFTSSSHSHHILYPSTSVTYTPVLNFNISSTLCHSVLICILSILCKNRNAS